MFDLFLPAIVGAIVFAILCELLGFIKEFIFLNMGWRQLKKLNRVPKDNDLIYFEYGGDEYYGHVYNTHSFESDLGNLCISCFSPSGFSTTLDLVFLLKKRVTFYRLI